MTGRDQIRPCPIDNWNLPSHKNVDAMRRRSTPDHIEANPETLVWFHCNDDAGLVANKMIFQQKVTTAVDTIVDPSRNLIFGVC